MIWKTHTKAIGGLKQRVVSSLAFIGVLVVNGLAGSTTLLGGVTTAEVSDKNANLFAPAGLTFAIWGVIYLLLIGFVVYCWGLARAKKTHIDTTSGNGLLGMFTLSSVLNVSWILAWQHQLLGLSVVIMAGLVSVLIKIQRDISQEKLVPREQFFVRAPFSIYAGWITVAAIANVTTWLVSIGWNGAGVSASAWTVIVLLIGAGIGTAVALKRRDWMYLGVFVWAYFGIAYKHLTVFDARYTGVLFTLAVAISGLAILTLLLMQRVFDAKR